MKQIAVFFINLYRRFISPLFPNRCRFYPTCSTYALEAFKRFGFFKGLYLSVFRIIRCNPFCKGGIDPVPPYFRFHYEKAEKEKFKIDYERQTDV